MVRYCLAAGALLAAGYGLAADWPQFRGPNASGVSQATTRLPVEFGPQKNVAWKTVLPPGHSSPVIFGDRIFLTGAEGGKRAEAGRQKVVDEGGALYTICLERRTGKILWKREVTRPRLERYQPTNSPASPSAVTDGKSVFVFFGDFGLVSYAVDGTERWHLPLGPFNNVNGHGSSPILVDNLLILLCDQDTNSYLLAVDKNTGRTEWKVERPESTRSYSTPSVLRPKGGPAEVIVPGAYQLTSYNAKTGEKLWWIRGVSWQPKSSPIIDGNMIYAHWWEAGGESEVPTETPAFADMLAKYDADHDGRISLDEAKADPRLPKQFADIDLDGDGFLNERDWDFHRAKRASRNALLAVRHGGRGDLTGTNIVWRMQKFLPNVPSPLLYQNVLYLVKDGGIVTSLDPKTGRILKQARLTGALDTYYSSPVGGAGKIYMISQGGKAAVLKAGAEWEILAVNDLEDECFATPAIVDNKLYVRTRNTLYCFQE
jgi:outer membrane protein assembly factor BamB